MKTLFFAALGIATAVLPCAAQDAAPSAARIDASASLSVAMPALAKTLIASYKEHDTRTYLDNLFRMQMVANRYDAAAHTLTALRALPAPGSPKRRADVRT